MVNVMYVSSKGHNPGTTRLYAIMPTLEMAKQQFYDAVRKAETNPRCPYLKVWIQHRSAEYCWERQDGD